MSSLKLTEVLEATKGKLLFGKANGVDGIAIDSRSISKGQFFVALRGERFDGHDFLHKALATGDGAIVSIPPVAPPANKSIVLVDNTLRALQQIARYQRRKFAPTVLGITGTNGKTTTKEMCSEVLGTKFNVLKNTGNLNNHIGLPLSLMNLKEEHEAAVLEMGASARGDIRELCEIAEPQYGVLTNVGMAHIEGFGSLETIRDTKLELLNFVSKVALNADDEFLLEGLEDYEGQVIRYGMNPEFDVYATEVELGKREASFTLNMAEGARRVTLHVTGLFNISNALAAAAAGQMFNVKLTDIVMGLERFVGVPMRLEINDFQGATVISDLYNANPASMEEAVKELLRMKEKRSIAVLGDMLELGQYAERAHRDLGKLLVRCKVDLFVAVGPLMALAAQEFKAASGEVLTLEDSTQARAVLLQRCGKGDTILVKGSRSMLMERVLHREGKINAI
jgi:UDP-N-acetylmuramoyl-tripeptide--D-alanyl-D-alanine ligase